MDIIHLLYPLKYLWLLMDASTHHISIDIESNANISFICLITFIYFNNFFSLIQASWLILFTSLVKDATDVWMSLLSLDDMNKIWATVWCNYMDCSYVRTMDSLYFLIWNMWSAAGEFEVYLIYSGNASIILFTYLIIDTFTAPFSQK